MLSLPFDKSLPARRSTRHSRLKSAGLPGVFFVATILQLQDHSKRHSAAMSLFGAQTPGSQPSLFGAPQSSQSLFGNQPASGPLFGAPASSASLFGAPASSASLFGAPASSSSLFGAPASSASLFGAPASSASLFGAPASSASLFGAPASSASLFGAPASSSSLFGAPASSASLFGPSAFGASQPQQLLQHQQQPQQVEITGRTRISELPPNFQKDLFAVERHLREQRSKSYALSSKRSDVDQSLSQTRTRSTSVYKRLVKLKADLDSLQTNADILKQAVKTERTSAEPIVVALENIGKEGKSSFIDSNGLRYDVAGAGMQRTAHVPEEYFTRVIQEIEARAQEYKVDINEIAEFLRSQGIVLGSTFGAFPKNDASGVGGLASRLSGIAGLRDDMDISETGSGVESKGKTIEEVIRRQYEYFMIVASSVATLNETLRSTKEGFLRLARARNPDGPDPFSQANLREKAAKDRQILMAEKSLPSGIADFRNPASAIASSQPSLFQSGTGTGGFGATAGSFGGNTGTTYNSSSTIGNPTFGGGLFGSSLGSTDNATDGSAKRLSTGRRKRA